MRTKITTGPPKGRGAEDKERTKEIRELRFKQKWTLNKIAIFFGVSRERIRQIVGNSGNIGRNKVLPKVARRIMADKELQDKISLEDTNKEVIEKLGISNGVIFRLRRGTRHAHASEQTAYGMSIEEEVSRILISHGIENKLMPTNHPYNIELADGRRVEVKSRKSTIMRTESGKQNFYFSLFHDSKRNNKASDRAEFFILVLPNDYGLFVVPSCKIPERTKGISFCYPEGEGTRKSKFWQYRDRFDLLK